MSYKRTYWIRSTSAINVSSPCGQWWKVVANSAIEAVSKWSEAPFFYHDSAFQVENDEQFNEKNEYGPDQGGEEGRVLSIYFTEAKNLDNLNSLCLERRIAHYGYPPSEAQWNSITLWEINTGGKFPWEEVK